ncbi:hypothetical protein FACS1894196_2180 [Clostridia bacterium]|nr:hypothetical protein FACS1894196_2180 [Clostridia bacterium]
MRDRRFPLLSVIVAVLIAAGVGYVSYIDVDVPREALARVGEAVSGLWGGLRLIAGSAAEGGSIFADEKPTPPRMSLVPPTEPPATARPDDPLPMLVNKDHPVPDAYEAEDLVRLRAYCDPNVVYITGSEIEGNRTAADALMVMLRAAIADGVKNWQVNAGYRSVRYQKQLWENRAYTYRQQGMSNKDAQAATAKYVALPGASEHHTGLAFDITVAGRSFATTEQSRWLSEHCWDYGFIIRYAADKEAITGISAEPWHIRYVGQPHAQSMREKNWCLEEYLAAAGR